MTTVWKSSCGPRTPRIVRYLSCRCPCRPCVEFSRKNRARILYSTIMPCFKASRSIGLAIDLRSIGLAIDLRSIDVAIDLRSIGLAIDLRSIDVAIDLRSIDVAIDLRSIGLPIDLRSIGLPIDWPSNQSSINALYNFAIRGFAI